MTRSILRTPSSDTPADLLVDVADSKAINIWLSYHLSFGLHVCMTLSPIPEKLLNKIIITTEEVVCTDTRRVITGLVPKGTLKVWHRITISGRR